MLAKRKYNAGDYVCEYDGELITYIEGKQRESEYDQSWDVTCTSLNRTAKDGGK